MGSSDNFCLRWNDFETNISSSFRELRQDKEFFDVTLCCDNGTDKVGAHKVILAACSPFFRRILGHNAGTPNPLLYLKGIQKKELQAILNFMYHGEVNVAQESLNAFLSCAEELAVKGLTTDSRPLAASSASASNVEPEDVDFIQPAKKTSQAAAASATPKRTPPSRKRDASADDTAGGSEEAKKIKPEPEQLGEPDADFVDDSYGGEGFDDSYGGGFDDMDDSAAMEGSEATKDGKTMRMEAHFVRSKFGNAKLEDTEGYSYFCSRKRGIRMYWNCSMRRRIGCRVRACTEGFFITKISDTHNHPVPEPSAAEGPET